MICNSYIVRAPCNNRNEGDTRRRYKEIIFVDGWVLGQGSVIVVVPIAEDGSDSEGYHVISGAHRLEALYECCAEDPENPQVQASIASGGTVKLLNQIFTFLPHPQTTKYYKTGFIHK